MNDKRVKVCMLHKKMFVADKGCVCCNIDDVLLEEAGYIRPDVRAMRFIYGQDRHMEPSELIKRMNKVIKESNE